jgi:hypothetical protein
MYAIVELSSSNAASWGNAEYTAKSDYRQVAFDHGAGDLAAGEKTLAYFALEDARFGGSVHIPYYDEDGTTQGNWELAISRPSGQGCLKGDRAGPGDLRRMTTTTRSGVS